MKCSKCGSANVVYYDSEYEEVYMEYTDQSDSPSYETRLVEIFDCLDCGNTVKQLSENA